MDPEAALERLGGTARRADLLSLVSRRSLRRALVERRVVRAGRDRYSLPAADQARRAAVLLNGYLTHLSAAVHHGWEVRAVPERPHVAIPRGRAARPTQVAEVRQLDLQVEDVDGLATNPLQTVLWCARDLAFPDALAVADSALRHGAIDRGELIRSAAGIAGRAGARARRVALYADGRAANPFESTLRAIAIEEGIAVVPQFEVHARGLVLHPDLVDPMNGVVLEAESWEFHGKEKRAFERDVERYTALVVSGWRVLRFTWAEVMLDPGHVRTCLRELYAELAAA
ncbi:MAG TPA: hypothetical protein VNS81_08320 [Nocardioides sp.]|nr:hypothetical protein [Nocardioides sp.]